MLLPEALGGWRGGRGAALGLALGFRLLHIDVVPVDTNIRAGKGVILRPKASQEGESFLLGGVEVDLVQLLRIHACRSLVRQDCGRRTKNQGSEKLREWVATRGGGGGGGRGMAFVLTHLSAFLVVTAGWGVLPASSRWRPGCC